jgi:hypothetical protein
MKKFLIAAAAATTLFAGASAANAGVKVHLNLGLYGHGYAPGYYHDAGYYDTKCFKKSVKFVKGYDYYGDPIFGWKTKKICKKVWIGY